MKMHAAWLGLIALVAGPAAAGMSRAPIRGPAYVIDGDTLVIHGTHVRLYGIDAFEHDQTCGTFACGAQAEGVMRQLTRGQIVTCDPQDIDHYGRIVAICKRPDGLDLNGEMVRRGLAVAYRTFSLKYLPLEKAAQVARAGAWGFGFQSPLDYRRDHPWH